MRNIATLLLLLMATSLQCQLLQRKGSLGSEIHNMEERDGVLITRVIPSSTAESLGVMNDDILIKANGTEIKTVDGLVDMTSEWIAGSHVDLVLIRDGKELNLSGQVKGRPYEDPKFGRVIYDEVPYQDGALRCLLNLPDGKTKPPVVFFIQGYSCTSIDIYYDDKNRLRQLIDGLTSEGYAVFRVEKPGMGDSKGSKDCYDISFDEEVAAFTRALDHLKKDDRIDGDQVFLFGHSLGGITAPLMAASIPVKGVVNYGSVATSWYEYMVKRARKQGVLFKNDPMELQDEVEEELAFLHDYLVDHMDETTLTERHTDYLSENSTPYIAGRNYQFMQSIQDADVTQALKECGTHVLALHGEADLAAVDSYWAEYTAFVVNSYRPGHGKWKLIEKTEHSFSKVGTMSDYMDKRLAEEIDGDYLRDHFNPEVVDVVVNWMEEIQQM